MTQAGDEFRRRSYGEIAVGFGRKPGIVVVDFQRAFTDAQFRSAARS